MERAMNKKGFTLVEMLVAIALLSLVLSMVSSGVVTAMKANRVHDAASASQTRARRVLEIVSQDLRSAALGAIINTPYSSNNNAVSFSALAGGAGYEARSTGLFTWFRPATQPTWTGSSALLVFRSDGDAFVAPINSTNWTNGQFTIGHANCRNAFINLGAGLTNGTVQNNNLLFSVDSIGYRFDVNQNRLLRRVVGGVEQTVAFDIENFEVFYVYRNKTNSQLARRETPMSSNNAALIEDDTWRLTQLQIDLDVAEPASGRNADGNLRTVTRTYTSYVDLTDSSLSFQVGRVATC